MKFKFLSRLYLFLLSGILFLPSCKEFIEPSIEKKTVQLQAPANAHETTNYTVNFWWDEVEDALHYRLQIVTPDFDAPASIVIDTLVKSDKISLTLEPGEYQWRLRAENGSSQTAYATPRNFTIVPGTLEEQTVSLLSPANNLLTKQSAINFQWKSLYGADKYQLQVDNNTFSGEIDHDVIIPATVGDFDLLADGVYYWRVRALSEDDAHQSKWSEVYKITYDNTPPGQVNLTSPVEGTSQPSPVTLQWNAVSGSVSYKVYVYKSDQTTLLNASFPVLVKNAANYQLTYNGSGETLYWRVLAVDAAGNEGELSEMRSFALL